MVLGLRLAAAGLLAAVAGVVLPAGSADAATCSSSGGVSVVVDFHELGGGVPTVCVADGGGKSAAALFPAAGFPLSYVQRTPGFVCQVSGKPASPCVNTPPEDAYWGLWWSDGKSGSWNYATSGAGGLTVPDGGYVAFSWNGSSTRSAPGVTPAVQPTPKPTPTPTTKPSHSSNPSGGGHSPKAPGGNGSGATVSPTTAPSDSPTSSASGSPSASGSAQPGKKSKKKHTGSAEQSPSQSESASAAEPTDGPDDAVPASAEPADPDGGLPAWVAPVLIVVLFGAVGGITLVRRRRSAVP